MMKTIESMKVLHLTLRKKWFDMIASGEKKEEYRDLKFYWADRLMTGWPSRYGYIEQLNPDFKHFDVIKFKNGYSGNAPVITVKFEGIRIGWGRKDWGANILKKYFVIKIGEIIK